MFVILVPTLRLIGRLEWIGTAIKANEAGELFRFKSHGIIALNLLIIAGFH